MKAVIQRASAASVRIEKGVTGQIDTGLVVLIGVTHDDSEDDVKYLAKKIPHLRIFEDENEKMNRSLIDVQGKLLSISQFTLYGDCRKGRRPNFMQAAKPETAEELYQLFNQYLEDEGVSVETGAFGEMMEVQLTNSGPVTLILDSKEK
ncbi:D-aminoacyl-tRNA deacylase [Halobacillus salinarum]|uniref:D-aminoacyl-tRNA deacylase n=1 Tax=Halobacillus salinarum TaxID=2932257 RepID=A0ABY4EP96_9BACI|nr:D-aminoacyl-tRNA deacylase [Halobacillus salinarum]UOQ46282.1 D-aminoacyl-tRNA deacylase [Halobacillus salinarum]